MATHSSILPLEHWKSSWTVELGGLQPMGFQRVKHNLATGQQQQQMLVVLSRTVILNWTSCCILSPPRGHGIMPEDTLLVMTGVRC